MRQYHSYKGISLDDASSIQSELVCELVDCLRYLDSEHRDGFEIDAVCMAHVTKVLARVDAAISADRRHASERAVFAAAQERFTPQMAAE